jgi:hypothetical protein
VSARAIMEGKVAKAAKKAEPRIKVRVTARQEVQYNQIKEIPLALFQKYEAMCDAATSGDDLDAKFNREFEHLIDYSDVVDADDLEDLEISPYKPKPAKASS